MFGRPCVCLCAWPQWIMWKNITKELGFKENTAQVCRSTTRFFCLHLMFLRATLPWPSPNLENVNSCLWKVFSIAGKQSIYYLLNKAPGSAVWEMTKRWPAHTIPLLRHYKAPQPSDPVPLQSRPGLLRLNLRPQLFLASSSSLMSLGGHSSCLT